jgi:plastocyanin
MKPAAMLAAVVVTGIVAALPIVASTNQDAVPQDARPAAADPVVVDFGHPEILTGAGNLVMVVKDKVVNEVEVPKGETVTFRTNGAGHGIAIYPVSKNTTHEAIAEQLCQGPPPDCDPALPPAQCSRKIVDGHGRLVIDIEQGTTANPIDYGPDRVLSVGAGRFLTGTAGPPAPTAGTLVRVQFEKHGRYLVVCMNRAHAANACMFGFVNVNEDVATPP